MLDVHFGRNNSCDYFYKVGNQRKLTIFIRPHILLLHMHA